MALIAHRRRVSQLVHHHSDSKELLRFKAKLNTALQALMVGQILFWLLSITVLVTYLHSFNAAYRLDKCRDIVTDQRRMLPQYCGWKARERS